MSIVTEITRLQNAKERFKTKLNAKNDSSHQITDETLDEYDPFIDSIPSGGAIVSKGVDFIDYDGTLIASYTPEEAQSLTALPEGPSHDGLVFDGWNWTLNAINSITGLRAKIGAMYHTSSGATECDISLTKTNSTKEIKLQYPSKLTSVDWGDGTVDSNTTHTYSDYGDYTIKLYGPTFVGSNQYSIIYPSGFLKRIRLAAGVTGIGSRGCYSEYALETITINKEFRSLTSDLFFSCSNLKTFICPLVMTSISSASTAFRYCTCDVIFSNALTSIKSMVFQTYFNKLIIFPKGFASLDGAVYDDASHILIADFTNCDSIVQILNSSQPFYSMSKIFKILVPDFLYDDWKANSGWAPYVNYIYKKSEV